LLSHWTPEGFVPTLPLGFYTHWWIISFFTKGFVGWKETLTLYSPLYWEQNNNMNLIRSYNFVSSFLIYKHLKRSKSVLGLMFV